MAFIIGDPLDLIPRTRTEVRRRWFRFRFPWSRTAISAPSNDDRLLIVNETDVAWSLHLGYRSLGVVDSRERRLYQVLKVGMLTARQVDAPVGAEYLTLHLKPSIHVVRIAQLVEGLAIYELRCTEGQQAKP